MTQETTVLPRRISASIINTGGTFYVKLPKEWLQAMELKEGDAVSTFILKNRIVVTTVSDGDKIERLLTKLWDKIGDEIDDLVEVK